MPGAIICRRRFVLAGFPGCARIRVVRLDFGTLLASIVWSPVAFPPLPLVPLPYSTPLPLCFCWPGPIPLAEDFFRLPPSPLLLSAYPPPSIRPYPRRAAQCINNHLSVVSFSVRSCNLFTSLVLVVGLPCDAASGGTYCYDRPCLLLLLQHFFPTPISFLLSVHDLLWAF